MLNLADLYSFSDKFSGNLNTINHLNLKLFIFARILQVLTNEFLKFRILEILNFHPWIQQIEPLYLIVLWPRLDRKLIVVQNYGIKIWSNNDSVYNKTVNRDFKQFKMRHGS